MGVVDGFLPHLTDRSVGHIHTCPYTHGNKQCDVVRAGFKENITLTLDGQTGYLIR